MSRASVNGTTPLSGIRVLDLGRHLAGPTAGMWLGDLGADVIKVEWPPHGDHGRGAGPPFFNDESAFFISANRNKRSVVIDCKVPGRSGTLPQARSRRRCGDREFPAGRHGGAEHRLRPHLGDESRHHLPLDLRLRRGRAGSRPSGARPDHPGFLGADERDRL